MCYAIVALARDLVWGYAGILSLGHGLFFALGGYGMGMYLMRQIGARGASTSPSSPTSWCSSTGRNSLAVVEHRPVLVGGSPGDPRAGLLAFVFGYFAFRARA
jgi:urea transport system permease protein